MCIFTTAPNKVRNGLNSHTLALPAKPFHPHSLYPSHKLSTFNCSYTCTPPTQLLPTIYQLLVHQCSIHTALTLPQSIIISYTRAPPTNPLPRAHKLSTFNFSHTSALPLLYSLYPSHNLSTSCTPVIRLYSLCPSHNLLTSRTPGSLYPSHSLSTSLTPALQTHSFYLSHNLSTSRTLVLYLHTQPLPLPQSINFL